MKIGFTGINIGNLAHPELGRLAQLADELGFESLWTAEHIVLPDLPPGPETPRPGTLAFLDSIALLGYLAACTRRLKLATGVLLLPQQPPPGRCCPSGAGTPPPPRAASSAWRTPTPPPPRPSTHPRRSWSAAA